MDQEITLAKNFNISSIILVNHPGTSIGHAVVIETLFLQKYLYVEKNMCSLNQVNLF